MSIISKLTPKDRKALALFYETEVYSSLAKLLKLAKANAAEKSLEAIDWQQVKHLQGQKHALDSLEQVIKEIHKKEN
jgi:hypothetical protein